MAQRAVDTRANVHVDEPISVSRLQSTLSTWGIAVQAPFTHFRAGRVVAAAAAIGLEQVVGVSQHGFQQANLECRVVGAFQTVGQLLAVQAAGAGTQGESSTGLWHCGKTADPALAYSSNGNTQSSSSVLSEVTQLTPEFARPVTGLSSDHLTEAVLPVLQGMNAVYNTQPPLQSLH